jgi:hypothetical protein
VGSGPLVTARTGAEVEVEIALHPPSLLDTPVLLALPELDTHPRGRTIRTGAAGALFTGAKRIAGADLSGTCGRGPEEALESPVVTGCGAPPAGRA